MKQLHSYSVGCTDAGDVAGGHMRGFSDSCKVPSEYWLPIGEKWLIAEMQIPGRKVMLRQELMSSNLGAGNCNLCWSALVRLSCCGIFSLNKKQKYNWNIIFLFLATSGRCAPNSIKSLIFKLSALIIGFKRERSIFHFQRSCQSGFIYQAVTIQTVATSN